MTALTAWRMTRIEAGRTFAGISEALVTTLDAAGSGGAELDARAARRKLQHLARAARACGLSSFSSIVLRLAERLEPCLRAGDVAPRDCDLLRRVAMYGGNYLDDPTDARAAAAMVDALATAPMPAADQSERSHLLQCALEEGAELHCACSVPVEPGRRRATDRLTGLPDRATLQVRLEEILRAADAVHRPVGVMSIGISGVEDIVDSLGPQASTAVVARVARELIRTVAPGGTAGRLADDHFVIVCTGLDARALRDAAAALAARLARSHRIGPHLVSISARVGLAVAGSHGRSATELLGNADAALHDARVRRLYTTQFFVPHMRQAALRRVSLEAQLRMAIEAGSFDLHYQPKLELATGRLCGLEALVRWRCAEHGTIGPAEFIPIAEESGLIVPLGEWVIETACEQLSRWRREGALEVPVAVNLSAVQLCSRHLYERICEALRRHRVPPELLELEITESALMRDADVAVRCLGELGRLGVRVAIDDFGTGYSNLSQLMRLPLTALKIDRSLVCGIATGQRDAAILRAIIDMARSIGARVVAEGVEHAEQRDRLAAAGCDEYQGYLIAMPMSAAQLRCWLARRDAKALAR